MMRSAQLHYPLLFKNKKLSKLVIVSVFDDIAVMLDLTALFALIVYYWNGSFFSVMGLSIVYSLPSVTLGTIAGAFADRYSIKKILLICNFLCFILTLLLAFVHSFNVLILIVLLRASIKVFFDPASYVYLRYALQDHEIVPANALFSLFKQLRMILVPGVGAFLLGFMSPSEIFVLTAIFFAISGFAATLLDKYQSKAANDKSINSQLQRLKSDFMEAITTLNKKVILMIAFYAMIGATFSIALIDGLFAIFGKYTGASINDFSLIMTAIGLGGIIPVFIFLYKGIKNIVGVLSWFLAGMGLSLLILSMMGFLLKNHFFFQLLNWSVFGFMAASVTTCFNTLLQSELPIEVLGRIKGYSNSLSGACLITAPIIGCLVSSYFSIYIAFALSGSLLVLTGIYLAAKSKGE